jgi:hypothetical protein
LPKTERHTLTADIGGTDSRMERSKQVRLSVGSFLNYTLSLRAIEFKTLTGNLHLGNIST